MRRLGHYVRPYWLQAGIASLAVSLKSLCDVAGPILVMVAVDRYLAPDVAAQDPSNAVAHWVANASPLARLLPRRRRGRHPPGRHLPDDAGFGLSLPVRPGLPDAMDRPEDHVRSAPRYLPPHAAHAHRLLRREPRGPAGHAPDVRCRCGQRHVHRRRAGHRERLLHAHDHGRRHARHQLVAGAAGLRRAAADLDRHAHLPRPCARELSGA